MPHTHTLVHKLREKRRAIPNMETVVKERQVRMGILERSDGSNLFVDCVCVIGLP